MNVPRTLSARDRAAYALHHLGDIRAERFRGFQDRQGCISSTEASEGETATRPTIAAEMVDIVARRRFCVCWFQAGTAPEHSMLGRERHQIAERRLLVAGSSIAELVNPAATFPFQAIANHCLLEASANFLNCQDGPPM